MTIIAMERSRDDLIKSVAKYYKTTADKIMINHYGNVYCNERKTRLQTDEYKGFYVCAFIK